VNGQSSFRFVRLLIAERISSRQWARRPGRRTVALLIALGGFVAAAGGQERAIDSQKSLITITVYKTGLLSLLGHDHEIAAPIAAGSINPGAPHVVMRLLEAALQVEDRNTSEKDRREIRKTMLGPEVLDTEHFPEIVFRSTAADQTGPDTWTVRGDLTLHGQTRAITLVVRERNGHYAGSTRLKQTEFGIMPIRVAGGAIRVKDEIRIDFDIQLAH
jgi:polyisoprenoid-binding protein YceI